MIIGITKVSIHFSFMQNLLFVCISLEGKLENADFVGNKNILFCVSVDDKCTNHQNGASGSFHSGSVDNNEYQTK